MALLSTYLTPSGCTEIYEADIKPAERELFPRIVFPASTPVPSPEAIGKNDFLEDAILHILFFMEDMERAFHKMGNPGKSLDMSTVLANDLRRDVDFLKAEVSALGQHLNSLRNSR